MHLASSSWLVNHSIRLVSKSTRLVAGHKPRPMAERVVAERLTAIPNAKERNSLALDLAETSFECYRIEEDFRDLIDKDPGDLDGILTALVNLQLAFKHLRDHFERLGKPLDRAIRRVDDALAQAVKAQSTTRRRRQ